MKAFLSLLFINLSLALVPNLKISPKPDTVDELVVEKYLGLWYQMYADPIVYATFEKDSFCATAYYGLNNNDTISVHNYAAIGSPTGTPYIIDGYAYQDNLPDEPGQLKVVFNSDDAAPFPAPYWVLELGPENANGLYDWAIVSDNLSLYLFVLARDVETFNTKYKSEVVSILKQLGFTGLTAPVETYQGKDCVYDSSNNSTAPLVSSEVAAPPQTVDYLDVDAFMGYWYQMYGDNFVFKTTSPGSQCATATYVLQSDGTIGVHNYQTTDAPDGEVATIDGYAYYDSPEAALENPGQLKLHFDIVPTDGPYWILALGPIESGGLYAWTVVSDPFMLSLFILARNVEEFHEKYETEVITLVANLGFTNSYNRPIPVYQGSDCVYETR